MLNETRLVSKTASAVEGITQALRGLGEEGVLRIAPEVQVAARNNAAFKLSGDIAQTFRNGEFETITAGELRQRMGLSEKFRLPRVFDDVTPYRGRFFASEKYVQSSDLAKKFLNLYDFDTGVNFNKATKLIYTEFDDDVRLFIGRAAGDNGLGGGMQFFVDNSYILSPKVNFLTNAITDLD